MTISTVEVIMERVKTAYKDSPIAVFYADDGSLDAMFAATIETQKRIRTDEQNLVGVFHRYMNQGAVRFQLDRACLAIAA